jgi:hypothetical protein
MIKLSASRDRKEFLNMTKGIHKKPTINRFNGDMLSTFALRSKTTQIHLLSLLPLIIALQMLLAEENKKIIRYKYCKGRIKTVIPGQGMVAHACNPSYPGGRHWKDHSFRPAQAKS